MDRNSIEVRIRKLEEELSKLKKEFQSENIEKKPTLKKQPPKTKKEVKTKKKTTPPKEPPAVKKELPVQPESMIEPVLKKAVKSQAAWLRFEQMVGERWLVWVGVVVFAAGFGIFLKYAFEQGWLGETARTVLGFLAGLLIIWFGEFLHKKKFGPLSQGLLGLALIIFYLTIFTAYHFYNILPPLPAFILFFCTTIGGMSLAAYHNGLPIAFLSILGAFATPLFFALPNPTIYYEPPLFSYLLIVDLGVLYVASIKRWRLITFLSFICTIGYFGGWYIWKYTYADFSLASGFAVAYFVLFSFMSTPQSFLLKKRSYPEDLILVILNPIMFLLIGYTMLRERGIASFIPAVPLFMAIYHFILSRAIRKLNAKDTLLYGGLMGTAIGLLTLPVPMLVNSYWITTAWALEAAIFLFIGALIDRKPLLYGGLIVFLIAAIRLFTVDTAILHNTNAHYFLYLNSRFFAQLFVSLSFAFGAIILGRFKNLSFNEKKYKVPLFLMFLITLFWITNLDLIHYFLNLRGIAGNMFFAYSTMLWSVFFLWFLIQGIMTRTKPLRIAGLCLMFATAAKMLLIDTPVLYNYYRYGYPFLFNVKFLSTAVFIISVMIGAMYYKNKRKKSVGFKQKGESILASTFAIMLFLSLNFEIFSFFSTLNQPALKMMRLVITTMLWTGFSCWFLITGIHKKISNHRIAAYILIGMTAFKLFLIDTPLLQRFTYGLPFILNLKFLSLSLLLGVIAVGALVYSKKSLGEDKRQNLAVPALWTTFFSFLFLGLNIEIITYFNRLATQSLRFESFIFTTILWTFFSITLLILGVQKNKTAIRITGLVFISLTFLKLIMENSTILYRFTYGFSFLFNLKFVSTAILLSALAYAAVQYSIKRDSVTKFEKKATPYLWTLFLILLFIQLHSQATLSFYRVWDLGEQKAAFAISLLWVIYGFGLLLVGIIKRILPLRISALSLFCITLFKVFLIDLSFSGKLYKMLALLGIGAIFLIASYFYRKYHARLRE